jgi:acyl-CoA dehydrogenase
VDFSPSSGQQEVDAAVGRICERFDAGYWLARDQDGRFPHEFHRAMADGGWLGICMPEEYGGSGLGIAAAATMMQAVTRSGAGMTGASSIHLNIFGLNPLVRFGTREQKERILPRVISGDEKVCFAVTEPNTGLDTTRLRTSAKRHGNKYVINGQKVWISTAQVAQKMLIIARTTPIEETRRPIDGLSLFYADIDRSRVSIKEIEKMGRKAIDSNELFIDNLEVPIENLIGEEGKGFRYLLHGLNPERILAAACAVGLGRSALQRAANYAKERVVFDRPIGQNQGIQHPLAMRWIELESAELLMQKAAWQYDNGMDCGPVANAAKYAAGEAGFHAAETAVLTHGGFGYAKEYHVERLFREAMIVRIAPVSTQLVLCHIAERVLGLPKSY